MPIGSVNSICCSKSMALAGEELLDELEEAAFEEEDEQSGWTSYLDITSSTPECYSQSFCCNSLSVLENISSMFTTNFENIEGLVTAFTEEQSHGSTVSDASSGRASRPMRAKKCSAADSRKRINLQQTAMCHHQTCGTCGEFGTQFELIREQLEDTATSSPISAEQYGAEDVSKRFKILETLIPHLKEVAVRENEEEILNAIIDHVHALELKVELLSKMFGIYPS